MRPRVVCSATCEARITHKLVVAVLFGDGLSVVEAVVAALDTGTADSAWGVFVRQ